jgi:hypothetical protein
MNELELKKAIAIEGVMWQGDGEVTPEFELNHENLERRTDEVYEFLRLLDEKINSAKSEAKEWAERAKILSDRKDRIIETIKNTMQASKLSKIVGKKYSYSFYQSGESVEWIEEMDFSKIPKKFLATKTIISLDKKLIKEQFDKKLAKVLKLVPSYALKPSKI